MCVCGCVCVCYNMHMTYDYPMIMPILPVLTNYFTPKCTSPPSRGVCGRWCKCFCSPVPDNIETIPGICARHGMPQQCLRWHGRGRSLQFSQCSPTQDWQSGLGILNRSRYRTLIIYDPFFLIDVWPEKGASDLTRS